MTTLLSIVIDGLVFASYLFIVSSGLTITFGVLRVLNIAHGGFYALGAFVSAVMTIAALRHGFPAWTSFLLMPVAAVLVSLLIGSAVEWLIFRKLYSRDEVMAALASFGLLLVIEGLAPVVFGADPIVLPQPLEVLGTVHFGGVVRDVYSLALIGMSMLLGLTLWLLLKRTTTGKAVTAVVVDPEMAAAMGINVRRIVVLTFFVGTFLGAFGGAITAPLIAVSSGLGVQIIVMSFAVIVIGGMGSMPGAMIGALLIGVSRAIAVHVYPSAEIFVIYLLMTISLTVRPQGIFAPPAPRKI